MKTRLALALAALVLLAFSVPALAQPYLAVHAGLAVVSDSELKTELGSLGELTFDTGFAGSLALGGSLGDMFRLEGEFGYQKSDLDELTVYGVGTAPVNGDLSTMSLMANAYLDLPLDPTFAPFLGAGIGAAQHEIDIEGAGSEDDTVFAYQVIAGLSVAPSESLTVDLQYRYLSSQDPDFDGLEAEADANLVLAGVRVTF